VHGGVEINDELVAVNDKVGSVTAHQRRILSFATRLC
jgi:hypothetical protein